jgi:hypothetical protein
MNIMSLLIVRFGIVGMDSMHTMDIESAYIVRLTTGVEMMVALNSSV